MAALERQWREELGGTEAAATALVMRKAHRLLTSLAPDKPSELAPGQGLRHYLGDGWVEVNPWAAGPIEKIDAALRQFFHS